MSNLINFLRVNLWAEYFTILKENLITRHTIKQEKFLRIKWQWLIFTNILDGRLLKRILLVRLNGEPRLYLSIPSPTSPTEKTQATLTLSFKRLHKSWHLWPWIIKS